MLEFRSDLKVELIHQFGTDKHIAEAAWVSSGVNEDEVSEKRLRGVVRALLREKHGTPFESGYFSFRINVPRGVRDEAARHRMLSMSSTSLRYTFAHNQAFIPPRIRPFIKSEGFKQLQPKYEPMSEEQYERYAENLRRGYTLTHEINQEIIEEFDSTEAARWLTHDGTYVSFIARLNPRSLMHFLTLRTHNESANHVSYPMWEIMVVADQMEQHFKEKLPITWEAWNFYGREAP